MILFDDLLCEVLTQCDFLFLWHFVHSFSVLSFIVAHFPKIEKVCKLFFNLHTLFYKLIQGGNLEVLRVLLGHSSISITQIYIHLAAQMQLVNNKFDSHLDTLTFWQAKKKSTDYKNQCFWLGWRDSNPRMTESKSVALPLGDSPIY